jgi:hypothetical protein
LPRSKAVPSPCSPAALTSSIRRRTPISSTPSAKRGCPSAREAQASRRAARTFLAAIA